MLKKSLAGTGLLDGGCFKTTKTRGKDAGVQGN